MVDESPRSQAQPHSARHSRNPSAAGKGMPWPLPGPSDIHCVCRYTEPASSGKHISVRNLGRCLSFPAQLMRWSPRERSYCRDTQVGVRSC